MKSGTDSLPDGVILSVRDEGDALRVRKAIRRIAAAAELGLVDRTKIETAASELVRNVLEHAGAGTVTVRMIERAGRRGVCILVEDQGPGIADLTMAMKDGHSTKRGLGLGLPGTKRLVDDFVIRSVPDLGTLINVTKWGR